MGTRSITHIYDDIHSPAIILCSFYRHWDGYPQSHGVDLAKWLKGKFVVNGKSSDFREGIDFNRIGTLAIPLMAHIQEVSGAEIIPAVADDYGEEYTYRVHFRDGEFDINFEDDDEEFTLTPEQMIERYTET